MLVSSRFFVRNVFLSTALWNSRRLVVVVNAMSTHTTTRNDGTVTIAPRNEASQSALMVICHGLGDSAEGFADVAEVRPSTTRSDLGGDVVYGIFGFLICDVCVCIVFLICF